MSNKSLISTAAAVVILGAGAYLFLHHPAGTTAPKVKPAVSQNDDDDDEDEAPVPDKVPKILPKREIESEFKDPRLKALTGMDDYTPSLEDLKPFLDAHQHSADALLAAYSVCKDQRVLEELMTTAPNERTYEAVTIWADDNDLREKAITALQKANPTNLLPTLSALAQGEEVSDEALKKALAAGSAKPSFDLSSLRQTSLRNEAWQSVVKEPVKAWAYAWQSMSVDLNALETVNNGILNLQTSSLNGDDDDTPHFNRVIELTRALHADNSDIAVVSAPGEHDLELSILGTVTDDSPYPGPEGSVGKRREALEAEMDREDEPDERIQAFLKDADPATVDSFVALWNEKGMNAAMETLAKKVPDKP